MRVRLLLLAFLACALPCRVSAQALNVIYLGKGQVLQALPPRQLSLNAHISEFQYQPGGQSIAYVGAVAEGTTNTQFIKVAGVQRGTTVTVWTETLDTVDFLRRIGTNPEIVAQAETEPKPPLSAGAASANLVGWSADGRFLITRAETAERDVNGDPVTGQIYTRYDMGIRPPSARAVPVPIPAIDPAQGWVVNNEYWSPSRTALLFSPMLYPNAGPSRPVFVGIYDPIADRMTPVTLADGMRAVGWQDVTHLRLLKRLPNARTFFSHDVATGQETPASATAPARIEIPSPKFPTAPALSLDVQIHSIPDAQKTARQESRVLWLRRAPATIPLAALPLGLSPGADDPQAQWSPTGRQIAFLAHGDLFVTDLIVRPARPREKLDAGEPLTCAEEKDIAVDNLKQVALAIFQYTQDHDEKFPAAEGMREAVMPYLKDDSLFQIGKIPFVYHGKGEALVNVDAISEFVLGTMDLPCAQITIYGDGHVRAVDKPQGSGRE